MSLSEQACLELLPWYINGTLTSAEKQAVESALSNSQELQEELNILKKLVANLPDEQTNFTASELGWKRLHKQIKAEKKLSVNNMPASNDKHWNKIAAIAAMLVIAIQVGLFSASQINPQQGSLQLLSGQKTVLENHQQLVQLKLSSDASWQEIVSLVNTLQGDIVQGPSALGLVSVRLSLDKIQIDNKQPENIQQVVEWLSQQSSVEYAAAE